MSYDLKAAREIVEKFNRAEVNFAIVAGQLPAALDEIERLRMAFSDLADDICGMQPVGTPDDAIHAISQHDLLQRCRLDAVTKARDKACDIAQKFATRMLGISAGREYRSLIADLRVAEVAEMQRVAALSTSREDPK